MAREVFVRRAHNHRITGVAAPLDPTGHRMSGLASERDVQQMKRRLVDVSRTRQIRRRAVIHRPTSGNGSIRLAEPPHFSAFVAKKPRGTQHERRLPRAAGADQRDRLTDRHCETDVTQDIGGRDATATAGAKPFTDSAKLERNDHVDRYKTEACTVSSRRRAHHRMMSFAQEGTQDQALFVRPARSEVVMMSTGGPGAATTPPPGTGTRSVSGRSRVVRRNPCPS
jgi:hypothetical protein